MIRTRRRTQAPFAVALGGAALLWTGVLGAEPASGVAECPVMREVVPDVRTAPHLVVNGKTIYFCCKTCPGKFRAHPEQFVGATVRDPVSGKAFHPTAKSPRVEQPGKLFLFQSQETRTKFLRKKSFRSRMPLQQSVDEEHGA